MSIYIYIYIYIYLYIYIYIIYIHTHVVNRTYPQNLLKTFYIATNSFMLSLDSDPQTIRTIMKNF